MREIQVEYGDTLYILRLFGNSAQDKEESSIIKMWHGALRIGVFTPIQDQDAFLEILSLLLRERFDGWIPGRDKHNNWLPIAFYQYSISYVIDPELSLTYGKDLHAEVTVSYRIQRESVEGTIIKSSSGTWVGMK